jgi:TP901 family phage tail tape measure protein
MPQTTDVKLRLLIEAVNNAGAQLQSVGNSLKNVGDRARDAQGKFVKMGNEGAKGADKLGSAMDRLKTRMDGVKKAGQALTGIGAQLGIAAAAMGAATAFPIVRAAQFEKTMNKVKAVTAGTTAEFQEMAVVAQRLGRTTKFTATEAAEGLVFLGMAGLTAKESIDALEPSLTLAAAGDLELAEAADIATNVLTGLGLEVDSLVHITDVLANTAKSANTNVLQLGEAFSYVAGTVSVAGMSADEAAAFLGIMANAGVRASRAGTTLKNIISGLNRVLPPGRKAFEKLGVTISKNADGTVDYLKTLEDLYKAGARQEDWIAIFQKRAGDQAAIIGRNAEAVRDLTKANEDAIDVAVEMREQMEEGLVGAFTRLRSAIDGLAQAFGRPALKPLADFVDAMAKAINMITEWVDQNPVFASALLLVTGAFAGLLTVITAIVVPLGLLLTLIGGIGGGLPALAAGFLRVKTAAKGFLVALTGIRTALTLLVPLMAKVTIAIFSWKIAELVFKLIEWKNALDGLSKAQQRAAVTAEKMISRLNKYRNYTVSINLETTSNWEDVVRTEEELEKAIQLQRALKLDAQKDVGKKNIFREYTEEALEAQVAIKNANVQLTYLEKQLERARIAKGRISIEEGELVGPPVPDWYWDELEKKQAIDLETEKMRISVMEDSAKKVMKVRDLELAALEKKYKEGEISEKQFADRRALIQYQSGLEIMALLQAEDEAYLKQQEKIRGAEIDLQEEAGRARLEALEREHEAGLISVEAYIEEKKRITLAGYDAEIAELKRKLNEAGLSLDEKKVVQIQIETLEIQRTAAGEGIEAEGVDLTAVRTEREQALVDETKMIRAELSGWEGDRLQAELEAHDAWLQQRYEQEKKAGTDLNILRDWMKAEQEKREKKEKEVQDAYMKQRLQIVKDGLGYMESMFADLYAASGQEMKAFFYAQKAVAVAEAIISTYTAANKAMQDTPGPGWLKMAMATTIVAAGMARVANIIATTIKAAEGGMVRFAQTTQGAIARVGATVPRFAEGGTVKLRGRTIEVGKVTVPRIPPVIRQVRTVEEAMRPVGRPIQKLVKGGRVARAPTRRRAREVVGEPIFRFEEGGAVRLRGRTVELGKIVVPKVPPVDVVRRVKTIQESIRPVGRPVQKFARGGQVRKIPVKDPTTRPTEPVFRFSKGRTVRKVPVQVPILQKLTEPVFKFAKGGTPSRSRAGIPVGPAMPSPTRLSTKTTPASLMRARPRKDKIPAWLTDKEYVMSRSAVRHYGAGFMEKVNQRKIKIEEFVNKIKRRTEETKPAGEARTVLTRVISPVQRMSEKVVEPLLGLLRPRKEQAPGRPVVAGAPVERPGKEPRKLPEVVRRQDTRITDRISRRRHRLVEFVDEIRKKSAEIQPVREERTAPDRPRRPARRTLEKPAPVQDLLVPRKERPPRPPAPVRARAGEQVLEEAPTKEIRRRETKFLEQVSRRRNRVVELVDEVKKRSEEIRPFQKMRTILTKVSGPFRRVREKEIPQEAAPVTRRVLRTGRRERQEPLLVLEAGVPRPKKAVQRPPEVAKIPTETPAPIRIPVEVQTPKMLEMPEVRRPDTRISEQVRQRRHRILQMVEEIQRKSEELRPIRETKTILTRVGTPLQQLIEASEPTRRVEKPKGGQIRGRPGIDKIPAWLQDEEFVIRAEAVRHYGVAFMELLNRRMVDFNQVLRSSASTSRPAVYAERFQEGGLAGPPTAERALSVGRGVGGTTINVPVDVTTGDLDLAGEIQDAVEEAVRQTLREYV